MGPTAQGISEVAITVVWTKPAENGATITGYRLQYRLSSATEWCDAPAVAGGDTLTSDVSDLTAATEYAWRVCAVNSAGESEFSAEALATTLVSTAAAAPDAVPTPTAQGISEVAITVVWTKPAENGATITGYCLQYRLSS